MPVSLWPLAAALAFVSLLMSLVANLCARRVLSRRVPPAKSFPPISILKPLKGVDDGLYLNLISFAQLDYPAYEVICGAEDVSDPALEVARRVQREFPRANLRIIQCRGYRGKNPKVRSLQALAAQARHEHLLISDSNVRVDSSWLRDTAAELRDPRVGLVTNPIAPLAPLEAGSESLGALFENLHLGGFVLGAIALPNVLAGRACVIGKSMLLRRAALESVGGFRAVRNVLAEDYLLGRKFELAGYRVVLSPHPISTVNERWSVSRFCNRHVRWGQMRRRISLAAYLGELLLNPLPLILAAFALRVGSLLGEEPSRTPMIQAGVVALLAVVFKCALDRALLQRLRGEPLPIFDSIWLPVKDLLIAAIWPVACVKRTLDWRGNALKIGRASRLFSIEIADEGVGQES